MKKIFLSLLIISSTLIFFSCSDDNLETSPTDRTSGAELFKTTEGAQVAMNGIYRMLFTSGDWTTDNTHQNFGILSTKLYTSLMGEDLLQDAQGNGWFYFDYKYDVRSRYTSSTWRSYATWNYYYQIVSNANYVLGSKDLISGDQVVIDNIVAQALTMRAYAYFILIQSFQQTYIGHEQSPGVPLYTEPTTATTEGKGRGTVEDVYKQINSDLEDAISLFSGDKNRQEHISHVDYYVANAIMANVKMVQNKWTEAAGYADEALSKPGLSMASGNALHSGFNSVSMEGVMWGAEVIADQSGIYASFFAHMDATADRYARSSRKCIYNWLYDKIPSTDTRKNWWNGPTDGGTNETKPYNQVKFRYSEISTDLGDYIFMRAEEMQLVKAEALSRADQHNQAKEALVELMKLRDPSGYEMSLDGLAMSNELTMGSIGNVTTLLDMIVLQRRIELWGETERIFDILRMKTGFDRNATGSNHSQKIPNINTLQVDNKEFILTIPQKEFDSNPAMDATSDQNPM